MEDLDLCDQLDPRADRKPALSIAQLDAILGRCVNQTIISSHAKARRRTAERTQLSLNEQEEFLLQWLRRLSKCEQTAL